MSEVIRGGAQAQTEATSLNLEVHHLLETLESYGVSKLPQYVRKQIADVRAALRKAEGAE